MIEDNNMEPGKIDRAQRKSVGRVGGRTRTSNRINTLAILPATHERREL